MHVADNWDIFLLLFYKQCILCSWLNRLLQLQETQQKTALINTWLSIHIEVPRYNINCRLKHVPNSIVLAFHWSLRKRMSHPVWLFDKYVCSYRVSLCVELLLVVSIMPIAMNFVKWSCEDEWFEWESTNLGQNVLRNDVDCLVLLNVFFKEQEMFKTKQIKG